MITDDPGTPGDGIIRHTRGYKRIFDALPGTNWR
jgi:hypothetical protein